VRRLVGHRALLWLGVFLPLAILFFLTAESDIYRLSPDPVAAAVPAWQLAEHGSLDLTGTEYPQNHWLRPWHGEVLSNRTPGVIAFGVPAALLARPFEEQFSLTPERLTAASVAAAAVATFALLLLELGATRREAALFAILGGLATSTWSVSADALWTHGPDQLLLMVAMLAAARQRYWLSGIALGVAELVRVHLVVVAFVLGVWLAVRQRSPLRLLQFGIPAAAGIGLLVGYAEAVFGLRSLSPGYAATGYDYTSTAVSTGPGVARQLGESMLGALISRDRGLLTVSPVLLILLFALPRAWRAAPAWTGASAVGGIAYFLVQSKLNTFTGGVHFYGYRLTLEPLTLWAPLLWIGWRDRERGGGWERAVQATLCLSLGVQALGVFYATPDAVTDPWRHWFVVEAFDPDLHPVICQGVVLLSILAAGACLLRRQREPVHSSSPPPGPPGLS
jgi:alpha-1,2-mannosyltransferase